MLFGRVVEVEMISAFLAGDAETVLVVSGEAGVGKTALLDAAAETAHRQGQRVLRAAALEFEADLQFGALNQLLQPMAGLVDELDAPQRTAMRVIMGSASGHLPPTLLAGAATLALLRIWARAQGTGVLLVMDDVQWLDLSSSMALIFALRRLDGANIRLLAAVRSESGDAFTRSGFRVHEVAALDDRSAEQLLESQFPALPDTVRRRLRADARGNPLALLELPIALETHGPGSRLPEVLPLTRRLQRLFTARIEALPEPTRRTLLLIVLAGSEPGSIEWTHGPVGADGLAPAERAGVVRVNPGTGRLEFRHPLIRSAVVELSTSEERRAAHLLLADMFARSPQRRGWHLGQAAIDVDEDVAGLLEAVSRRMLHDGDSVRAAATMLRAAELSPAVADRARRTARAAYLGSLLTGDLSDTGRLLRAASESASGGHSLAVALAAAFQLLNAEGDVATASRLLLAALHSGDAAQDDPETVVEALHTLLYIGFYSGRAELWPAITAAMETLMPEPMDTLSLLSGPFVDPVHAGPKVLGDLDSALEELRFSADPVHIVRVATAGAYLDRIWRVREPLQRVIEDGRAGGAVARGIDALFLIGNDDYFCGRWDHLLEVTGEGLGLCDDLGYLTTAGPGKFLRGMVAAARGDIETMERISEQLLMFAAPRNLLALAHYASHIRCAHALATSAFADAYRHAASINPPGTFLRHTPQALWTVLDLTEAAARSGRLTEARAHAAAAEAAALEEFSPRLAMITKAARALAHPEESAALFDTALTTPGTERWIFDRARIELLYGEQLRRDRATVAARAHLSSAATVFADLKAEPWSRRTQAELRAAGGSATGPGASPLTAQERAVADLAAIGLTNKQIGAQLFVSARTVSTHLQRVFHKLGITRRGALRDALRQQTGED
ncbi:AAA family ATPase [Nocardia sp. NPDC059240]|uniref:AAA family ATPase n=1 Tax=Nocardia sp. NPDC059240 TaxID=3346786 RepID=UPI0036A2646D